MRPLGFDPATSARGFEPVRPRQIPSLPEARRNGGLFSSPGRRSPLLYNRAPPMSKFYLTTAIHYVNDDPHIGHMYENIVADVIARHRRRMGDDVRFLTGTDEHGQKIERAAAKEGILPIELADRVVQTHHALWSRLHFSHDDFIPGIDYAGAATFLPVAQKADVSLFM